MKKIDWQRMLRTGGLMFLVAVLLLAAAPPKTEAAGTREILLGYNDELTGIKAEMNAGSVYVPLRETAQKLQLKVGGTTEQVLVSGSKHSIVIVPGKQQAVSGSKTSSLKTYVSAGRLMVPVSLFKGTFNYAIAYDASVPLVRITSGKQKLNLQSFIEQNRTKPSQAPGKAQDKPKTSKPVSSKPIYLTFDDGPTAHTNELLDILAKYDARGTFFMLGPNIASYPKSVKRLIASGSAAGLHGMTHVKNKFYASPESALAEMKQDNDALYKAAGVKSSLIRTPYGSKPYFKQAYRDKVLSAGFRLWDWNVDSEDWKYKTDHTRVIRSVLDQINTLERQGTVPVVLMHDQAATLKVLPEVLKTLKSKGYTFEVIDSGMTPVNFWHDKR